MIETRNFFISLYVYVKNIISEKLNNILNNKNRMNYN